MRLFGWNIPLTRAVEGMRENKANWVSIFQWLRWRDYGGLKCIVEGEAIRIKGT